MPTNTRLQPPYPPRGINREWGKSFIFAQPTPRSPHFVDIRISDLWGTLGGMPNPAKPIEMKRKLGNPGKRAMPGEGSLMEIEGGWREPLRPLGDAGMQLWHEVFEVGGLWISSRTDVQLLQMVCELLDRREILREEFLADPTERKVNMSLLETEKLIQTSLSLLGFTPSDRSKLGLAEVKAKSKLEELMERRANRDQDGAE